MIQQVQTPDELVGVFRARGLKMTPQRYAVFQALHGNHTHPTAEAVHASVTSTMPSVSLRTVYSVLGELAAFGQIRQIDLGTGSARFDPNTADHHHLVCESCGMVRDVSVRHPELRPVPVGQVTDAERFTVSGTDIVFRGRCGECPATHSTGHRSVDV
jgi:Fe2+ or Zn2+ uptake regulation protein